MKLFMALEDNQGNNTDPISLYQSENEIVVYATIGNKDALKKADSVEQQTEWTAFLEKKGCKARVRVIEKDGNIERVLTLKVKDETELHAHIDSSKEYSIPVDENFINAFTIVADKAIKKTRYIFDCKHVQISYTVAGETSTIELENLIYEVDVYDNVPDMCKIEIEIDNILSVLSAPELADKDVHITAKVSHLPFEPIDVFSKFSEGGEAKVSELWDKIKA